MNEDQVLVSNPGGLGMLPDFLLDDSYMSAMLCQEEAELMRALGDPLFDGVGEHSGSGSDDQLDDKVNEKQVVIAAQAAAGLSRGGLKRAAFSMNDLTALEPSRNKQGGGRGNAKAHANGSGTRKKGAKSKAQKLKPLDEHKPMKQEDLAHSTHYNQNNFSGNFPPGMHPSGFPDSQQLMQWEQHGQAGGYPNPGGMFGGGPNGGPNGGMPMPHHPGGPFDNGGVAHSQGPPVSGSGEAVQMGMNGAMYRGHGPQMSNHSNQSSTEPMRFQSQPMQMPHNGAHLSSHNPNHNNNPSGAPMSGRAMSGASLRRVASSPNMASKLLDGKGGKGGKGWEGMGGPPGHHGCMHAMHPGAMNGLNGMGGVNGGMGGGRREGGKEGGVGGGGQAKIGTLTLEERRARILRYRQKRHERNFRKRIKYNCRKTLADSRPRIRGRFARNDEIEELMRLKREKEEGALGRGGGGGGGGANPGSGSGSGTDPSASPPATSGQQNSSDKSTGSDEPKHGSGGSGRSGSGSGGGSGGQVESAPPASHALQPNAAGNGSGHANGHNGASSAPPTHPSSLGGGGGGGGGGITESQ